MADRKVLFRFGTRVDELSPTIDRARVGGVVSAATLDLASGAGNGIQMNIGPSTKVTITSDGRTDTTASSVVAALRLGSYGGDPGTVSNGDLWYNSATGRFRAHENGVSVDVIGGAAPSGGWTDSDTVVHLTTSTDTVAIGISSMFGTEKLRVVGSVVADNVGQLYVAALGGVVINRVVYKNTTANEVAHASAASLAACNTVLGVTDASVAAGLGVRVITTGLVTLDAQVGVSVAAGDPVYLSVAGNGEVTNVEPAASGQVKFFLGIAKTPTAAPGGTFTAQWLPRIPCLIP